MHVVLYQPKIPPNTGNIARQCVGMNAKLHIVGPIEFDLSEHAVKRAGLDYWRHLDLTSHASEAHFLEWLGPRRPWLVTKFGHVRYDLAGYVNDNVLIFGNEITGLPEALLHRWPDRTVFIPMLGPVRSYNLSNAVAIVLAQACLNAKVYDRKTVEPSPFDMDMGHGE